MALAIYLGSTYLINRAVSPRVEQTKKSRVNQPPANEAKFRSLLKAGNQAASNGQYDDALARYLEAETSADLLTDEQYDSLKKSRLRIAQGYESSGNASEDENVYRVLSDSAIHQGQAMFNAKHMEEALVRAQDAEQFSSHLNTGRRDALQQSASLSVNSLEALHRYPEAEQAEQRVIDYLKASNESSDDVFADAYLSLATIYAQASDWSNAQQTLELALGACDNSLTRSSQENDQTLNDSAQLKKNWAQYNLVIAYYREGNIDTALSKADDFYTEASQKPSDATHPVAYHAVDFAGLGMQIAKSEKRQDAIDLWQRRGADDIRIISLHPLPTR